MLDATGMRVGELERLTWGDLDEPAKRWRVSRAVAKTGQARWVPVSEAVFTAPFLCGKANPRLLQLPDEVSRWVGWVEGLRP